MGFPDTLGIESPEPRASLIVDIEIQDFARWCEPSLILLMTLGLGFSEHGAVPVYA